MSSDPRSDATEAAIQKVVDEAPPLSNEQRKRLASVLGGPSAVRLPTIPITASVIHPRPERPTHVHCGVCGETWEMPALDAHLVYDKAVAHGGNEHPDVDARINVKPGKGPA